MMFLGFSILCALSNSLTEMILCRAGQGFTGGVLIPTAITIVRSRLPANKQPIGVALFGMVATFAPAIGPTVGGWLTENWSWHYIFYINVLPGVAAIAIQLWCARQGAAAARGAAPRRLARHRRRWRSGSAR